MVTREELLALAEATGLTAPVVEKDYVLGWLLRGIFGHEALRERWTFKGGTCLKKCYFETYRFSEDLDFTLRDAAQIDAALLTTLLAEVSQSIHDEVGIEIPADRLRFDLYANPRGHPSIQGRVYFRSQFQAGNNFPAVILDLTADELLVDEPVWRPVVHPYSDEPDGGIEALCYSYEEVFAEKLRALGERTRARDLFDVVNLYRNDEYVPKPARVREILLAKCGFKQIAMITLELVQAARDTVVATWEGMLRHQLPELPPFDSFWAELPRIFAWLQAEAPRPVLAAAPLEAETTVLRPRFGGFAGLIPNASAMERIRFAAQNRLLVEIQYTTLEGEPRAPTVEPYSLRRSKAGDVSLAAFDVNAGHMKKYRVERIHNARILEQAFTPRYEIELGPQSTVLPTPSRSTFSRAPFLGSSSLSRRAVPGLRSRPPAARQRFSRGLAAPPRARAGPTYTVQCLYCQRKFKRSSYDSNLNPHKMPSGWDCPGRIGTVVDTKW